MNPFYALIVASPGTLRRLLHRVIAAVLVPGLLLDPSMALGARAIVAHPQIAPSIFVQQAVVPFLPACTHPAFDPRLEARAWRFATEGSGFIPALAISLGLHPFLNAITSGKFQWPQVEWWGVHVPLKGWRLAGDSGRFDSSRDRFIPLWPSRVSWPAAPIMMENSESATDSNKPSSQPSGVNARSPVSDFFHGLLNPQETTTEKRIHLLAEKMSALSPQDQIAVFQGIAWFSESPLVTEFILEILRGESDDAKSLRNHLFISMNEDQSKLIFWSIAILAEAMDAESTNKVADHFLDELPEGKPLATPHFALLMAILFGSHEAERRAIRARVDPASVSGKQELVDHYQAEALAYEGFETAGDVVTAQIYFLGVLMLTEYYQAAVLSLQQKGKKTKSAISQSLAELHLSSAQIERVVAPLEQHLEADVNKALPPLLKLVDFQNWLRLRRSYQNYLRLRGDPAADVYALKTEQVAQRLASLVERQQKDLLSAALPTSDFPAGLAVTPIVMTRLVDGHPQPLRGEAWTIDLEHIEAVHVWAEHYRVRDLQREVHQPNDPNLGKTVEQYVQDFAHPENVVLAVNNTQEGFVMNNTLLVDEGRIILPPPGRHDILQSVLKTPYQPPHGRFHILSLDSNHKGIFDIDLLPNGEIVGDLPVRKGYSGPLIMRNGQATIDGVSGIRFGRQPSYAGDDVNWLPNKRQAFSASGYDARGRLWIIQVAGAGDQAETSDPTLREAIEILKVHGVRDAILSGTSADVQRYSPFVSPIFIWTRARLSSLFEKIAGTPRGRRVGAALLFLQHVRSALDSALSATRTRHPSATSA